MSFDLSTFEAKAVEVVNTITALDVVWSHQNAPRPDGSYVTLQILSILPYGVPEEIPTTDENQKVVNRDRLVMQVKAIGSLSMGIAKSIRNAFSLRNIQDDFTSVYAGMGAISQITSVPVARENGWESQSVFDVTFNIATELTEDAGYISKLVSTGTIDSRPVDLTVEE